MGKSSILRNLDQAARPLIAYVNLQAKDQFRRVHSGFAAGTGGSHLRRSEAGAQMRRSHSRLLINQHARLGADSIQSLMEQVRAALNDSGLILALTNSKRSKRPCATEKVGKEIYQFCAPRHRNVDPVVFGGLHRLDK